MQQIKSGRSGNFPSGVSGRGEVAGQKQSQMWLLGGHPVLCPKLVMDERQRGRALPSPVCGLAPFLAGVRPFDFTATIICDI